MFQLRLLDSRKMSQYVKLSFQVSSGSTNDGLDLPCMLFTAHFSSFLKDNDNDGHHYGNYRFTSHPSILAIHTYCSAEETFQFFAL